MTAATPITAAHVGAIVDGVLIRQAPARGCYGCQGTGRLRWAGIAPAPCSCVTHGPDCEPESCDCEAANEALLDVREGCAIRPDGTHVGR